MKGEKGGRKGEGRGKREEKNKMKPVLYNASSSYQVPRMAQGRRLERTGGEDN